MKFQHPWPAPDAIWNDPPWILSGRCLTAWFETEPEIVRSIVSPSFKSKIDKCGVMTRVRFYDVAYQPGNGGFHNDAKIGIFREAVIAFRGEIAGVSGEYSAFMWTDDFTYATWGREIFGWPLQLNRISLKGEFWGEKNKRTISDVKGDDYRITLELKSIEPEELDIGGGQVWLTPRRTLLLDNNRKERSDLLLVRPKVLEPGTMHSAAGSLNLEAKSSSILYGLQPLGDVTYNLHKNFKILVGSDVKVIKGKTVT
jgi:hypothetical protein